MKLWLLRPRDDLPENDDPWEPDYDKSHGFIIRAADEDQARAIAMQNAGDEKYGRRDDMLGSDTTTPWLDGKYSTCDELSVDGEAGMLMRDFAAA